MAVKAFSGVVPPAEQCNSRGCVGAAVQQGRCLGHLRVGAGVEKYLAGMKAAPPEERVIDLRGVEISPDFWSEIARHLREAGSVQRLRLSNAVLLGDLDLDGLTVLDLLAADGVAFQGDVRIRGCRFRHAFFMGSEFSGVTRFGAVSFEETCDFRECTFNGMLFAGEGEGDFEVPQRADFVGVSFGRLAAFQVRDETATLDFSGSTWRGDAGLNDLTANGISLDRASIGGDLVLARTTAKGALSMRRARVDGLCVLERAWCGHLDLSQAHFSHAFELGVVRVEGWAVLDQAVFEEQVRLRIDCAVLHCHRTLFQGGASIALTGDLVADGSFFPPPSDIYGVGGWLTHRPRRILSLRRADVAGLSLSDVDLSCTLLAGVHHLERSRLGSGLRFGHPPGRRHSSRDVLAEEQWLRGRWQGPRDWSGGRLFPKWFEEGHDPPGVPRTLPVDRPEMPDGSAVAETYRSLRKAREEGKDSPGAASFYYGEMEMRRRALRGAGLSEWPERATLGAYWFFSGYGLRLWRSLLTLLLVICIGVLVLWAWGFREPQSFRHAARVTVASATSLVRPVDDSELDGLGFGVEIFLRFTGPVLLALSAFALRARIKR